MGRDIAPPMDSSRQALERVLPSFPTRLVSGVMPIVILLALAGAIYRWIEQPGRQMLRHLAPARRAAHG
jgi:hypothetical protein